MKTVSPVRNCLVLSLCVDGLFVPVDKYPAQLTVLCPRTYEERRPKSMQKLGHGRRPRDAAVSRVFASQRKLGPVLRRDPSQPPFFPHKDSLRHGEPNSKIASAWNESVYQRCCTFNMFLDGCHCCSRFAPYLNCLLPFLD